MIFVIFLPYLGVFVYLIARGHKMQRACGGTGSGEPTRPPARTSRTLAGGTSSADELARLADLKAQGVMSEAEYQKMKAQVIGS